MGCFKKVAVDLASEIGETARKVTKGVLRLVLSNTSISEFVDFLHS